MEKIFKTSSEILFSSLKPGEALNLNYAAEETDFIRMNNSKVRQAAFVQQGDLTLEMVKDKRKSEITISLTPDLKLNEELVLNTLQRLRAEVEELPEDPFVSGFQNAGESHNIKMGSLPSSKEFVEVAAPLLSEVDLAGHLTSGTTYRGNANSLGQYHWFASSSFFFDYSLYTAKEKAVKGLYAGQKFDAKALKENLSDTIQSLSVMSKDSVEKPPGKYRAYLAPAAIYEIMGIFNWHGLSGGSYKRGDGPLTELFEKKKSLSPLFSLRENFEMGFSPQFNEWGEVAANTVPLIEKGEMKSFLASRLTAEEFGLKSNQSNESEGMRALEIATGSLKKEDILKSIGTGFYISNLHYLNWSDKMKARVTGMTRFGCLWVEDGKVVGPIKDLRFDDTLYDLFGSSLESVTDFSEVFMETSTYYKRAIGGSQVPGMLVKDMNFTL